MTWSFIEAFAELGRNTKPVFVSEGGLGSSFNAIRADRKMREAGAPDNAPLGGGSPKPSRGCGKRGPSTTSKHSIRRSKTC
jgi:hypothetical protein